MSNLHISKLVLLPTSAWIRIGFVPRNRVNQIGLGIMLRTQLKNGIRIHIVSIAVFVVPSSVTDPNTDPDPRETELVWAWSSALC